MKVYPVFPRGFAANTYLVTEDGVNAVAVDPAQPRVLEEAARRGLTVRYALLTHGHFDHVGGCAALRAAGAKIGCLETERDLAEHGNLAREMGGYFDFPPVAIDFTFRDGEKLSLCGVTFTALATPGHTAGSCCFLADGALFSGDTLFAGDVGRTDLPTGSAAALAGSLARLFALQEDLRVYPGHGDETTLGEERTC